LIVDFLSGYGLCTAAAAADRLLGISFGVFLGPGICLAEAVGVH